jgi:hypothetical protein
MPERERAHASEPREWSEPAKRRANERVGESEGRSPSVEHDAFFISIESWDPRFDPSATRKLLESLGARSVELLES